MVVMMMMRKASRRTKSDVQVVCPQRTGHLDLVLSEDFNARSASRVRLVTRRRRN